MTVAVLKKLDRQHVMSLKSLLVGANAVVRPNKVWWYGCGVVRRVTAKPIFLGIAKTPVIHKFEVEEIRPSLAVYPLCFL